MNSFKDFHTENGSSQGQNLAVTGLLVPSSLGSGLNLISRNMFIDSFLESQFPHKSVILSFIITDVKQKVDGFARESTFAKRLYKHFM